MKTSIFSLLLIALPLETLITPEQFAEIMCEDLQLPAAQFSQHIARGIKEQVQDYYLHAGSTVLEDEVSDNESEYASLLESCKSGKALPVVKQERIDEEDTPKEKKRKSAELRMLMKVRKSY